MIGRERVHPVRYERWLKFTCFYPSFIASILTLKICVVKWPFSKFHLEYLTMLLHCHLTSQLFVDCIYNAFFNIHCLSHGLFFEKNLYQYCLPWAAIWPLELFFAWLFLFYYLICCLKKTVYLKVRLGIFLATFSSLSCATGRIKT